MRAEDMTPAARLEHARLVGAGVRLTAGEVARLCELFPRMRKLGADELAAAAEIERQVARNRGRRRRIAADPTPALPGLELPAPPAAAATTLEGDVAAPAAEASEQRQAQDGGA